MNFRPTSGQTSGEKNFRFFLLAQKNRLQILRGTIGGRLNIWLHLLVGKAEKPPLAFKKAKEDATVN